MKPVYQENDSVTVLPPRLASGDAAAAAGDYQERGRDLETFLQDTSAYDLTGGTVLSFIGQGKAILKLMGANPSRTFTSNGTVGFDVHKINGALSAGLTTGTVGHVLGGRAELRRGLRNYRDDVEEAKWSGGTPSLAGAIGASLRRSISDVHDKAKHQMTNYLIVQLFDRAVHLNGYDSTITSPRTGQLLPYISARV